MKVAPARSGGAGIEAVNIRKQHQAIGRHHGGDACRQPVIVAVADFGRCHRVILIDDGNSTLGEQGGQGGAGIEMAAALFGVGQSHQHLGRHDFFCAERFRPGLGEGNLAHGCGGLAFFKPQLAFGKAKGAPAQGNGAGGDDDDVGTAGSGRCKVIDKA